MARRPQHHHASTAVALVLLVLAGSAAGQSAKGQVVPAAASQAPAVGQQVGSLELQSLGACTDEHGLSSATEKCTTTATLSKPGQSHWYRFFVNEADSAFSLHLMLRTQNGRVRMGVWVPGQKLDEAPAISPVMLLSSSFAQEQYMTLPASELFNNPGSYTLQIMNEYGSPEYTLSADITSGTTLLADEDKKAIAQVVEDCCPTTQGMVCSMLAEGLKADNLEADLCHQGAVQCDKAGRITDLVLQGTDTDTDLTCPSFSAGFAALPQLQRLDLAGARLGANLPTIAKALAPAKQLKWLVLRTAGVVGELSCDIVLPGLQLLSLTRNSITGTIPDCFTKTASLKHLYLSDNALSGPLPDFDATSALQLFFVRNQVGKDGKPTLSGDMPASLGAASALQYVQLAANALSGSIAGLPADLKYLNVSGNQLGGALPSLPTSLVSLDVSANAFEGSLPEDMSAYNSLVDIQAYYNRLGGELPSHLPPGLIQLALTGNGLTGAVPALPRGMKYLSLAENGLSGPLPSGPGAAQLWFADLSSNAFTGSIPSSLSQSANLVYLNVSNNQLSGIEAAAAWSTPALMTLDASYNKIAGALPAALARQPALAHISFADNALSGGLEPFAKALVPDGLVGAVFDVSNNQLEGPLPNALSNLAAFSSMPATFPSWTPPTDSGFPLKVFNVAYNKLSGPFPAFLYSNLTNILAQYCADADAECHLWVAVNGGGNALTCPAAKYATHSGLLPEDFAHLARQGMVCVSPSDGASYEIASVLQGSPKKVTSVEATLGTAPSSGHAIPPGGAAPQVKAAARQAADSKSASSGGGASAWWRRAAAKLPIPLGAAIGIAVGVVVALVAAGVLGYVFVYRRWWTVRAATRFQKMHEGPLAAAGGATVNSSAPSAALPNLQAPQAARGDAVV